MWQTISDKISFMWEQCTTVYHVNPTIFATLYVVKSIIFWWLMAVIVRRIAKRQWQGMAPLVIVTAVIDVLPWAYVYIWGENYPWWYPYMVYAIGGWCIAGIIWDIVRKLKKPGEVQEEKK